MADNGFGEERLSRINVARQEVTVQVNISARHGHLSTATQEKISEKVERLRKFFDRITSMEVTADLDHKESPKVELRITAEHSPDFVATDEGDLMVALDRVIQKMEQQLRKHKEKITGHRAESPKYMESPVEAEDDDTE